MARRLRDLDEIEDCWFIAGDDSYMLKVRVGDVDGLEQTIRRLSGTKGVSRTRTTIVLSTKWENRVGELPEERRGVRRGPGRPGSAVGPARAHGRRQE